MAAKGDQTRVVRRAKDEREFMKKEALYVAAGVAGLVKVGRTSAPHSRESCLRRDFRMLGDEISSFAITPFLGTYASQEEKELIDFVKSLQGSSLVHGREYFKGVDPAECFEKASTIAKQRLDEIAEAKKRHEIYMDALIKKREAKKAKKLQELEDLKKQHFSEFIEMQKQGLIPIPEVTNEKNS